MSLILKGIDMPKKGETIYVILREDEVKCQRWEDIDDEYETPAENLHTEAIQIPKGHGDIKDINTFLSDLRIYESKYCGEQGYITKDDIIDAPTILEAEE